MEVVVAAKKKCVLKTKLDHPVTISLPVNRTTGFSWNVDFCDPALKCEQPTYRQYPGGLGAGGIQKFTVRTQRTGEFLITFQLKRPWETKIKEERTYRIVVT